MITVILFKRNTFDLIMEEISEDFVSSFQNNIAEVSELRKCLITVDFMNLFR